MKLRHSNRKSCLLVLPPWHVGFCFTDGFFYLLWIMTACALVCRDSLVICRHCEVFLYWLSRSWLSPPSWDLASNPFGVWALSESSEPSHGWTALFRLTSRASLIPRVWQPGISRVLSASCPVWGRGIHTGDYVMFLYSQRLEASLSVLHFTSMGHVTVSTLMCFFKHFLLFIVFLSQHILCIMYYILYISTWYTHKGAKCSWQK